MAKLYRCDNCNFESDGDDAIVPWWEAGRLSERLNAGDIVPYGVCPECGCFVYRYDKTLMLHDAASILLEALHECVTDDGARSMTDESRNAASICRRRLVCINAIAKAAIAKAEGKSS